MSATQEPSYEELAGLVVSLRAEIVELKRQLARNSANSSQPPSADSPFVKPAPTSLRSRSGRRPGGQPGHPGITLCQVENPDRIVAHEPDRCDGCGASLAGVVRVGVDRRQVFDIPPIAVAVTEHQIITRRCGCGCVTAGRAPGVAEARVSYGPNTAAFGVYLYAGQFLSRQRTAQALAELFGTPVSAGTISAFATRAAAGLAASGVLDRIVEGIAGSPVAHFDETGLRVAARLHWVHSASTGEYCLITVHPRRGVDAMTAAGVLPRFTGVAVHDAWAPYDTFTAATHALCGAHVLRELVAVAEQTPEGQWCWAIQARDGLLDLKRLADTAHAAGQDIDTRRRDDAVHRLHSAAVIGARSGPAGKLANKHRALARRLRDRQADYLRFLDDPHVPFDNNAAEREIRMIKLRQKVSGSIRTLTGARAFCAIRSYLATAAKHGIRFIDSLTMLAQGRPWLPQPA